MLEITDLSAAVRKEAEAAGMEDTSDALGWLNYPGGTENYAFSSDLAAEMIMYAVSKIDRASWTPLMHSLSFGSAPKVSSGDNCDEATKAAASEATEAPPPPPRALPLRLV